MIGPPFDKGTEDADNCKARFNALDSSSSTKRSRPVMLSAAKHLCAQRDRCFAALSMTQGNCLPCQGLFFTIEPCLSISSRLVYLTSLQDTLGVFDAQLLMHKPLGSRAAPMADIVLSTTGTGSSTHLSIEVKESGVLPDLLEAVYVQIARLKFWSLEEGTWIDLTLWTNTTRGRCRSTHIETR